jgi:hypothetical protein
MKARNQQDSVGFNFEEQAVREPSNTCAPSFPIDNRKAQRKFRDEIDGIFDGLNESFGKRNTYVRIPLLGFVELCDRVVRPDYGQAHRFGSPAFTCSHGVPTGGFASYEAMRRSSSSSCSGLSEDACASRSAHSASSNSNFSASERLLILLGRAAAMKLRLGTRIADVNALF